jgi:hypothetical protein
MRAALAEYLEWAEAARYPAGRVRWKIALRHPPFDVNDSAPGARSAIRLE